MTLFRFPLLRNSDFAGLVYLTLSETKIELEPVEPGDPRVDLVSLQLGGQVLVVLSQRISIGNIIVCHCDFIVCDPNVSFQPLEVGLGQIERNAWK